VVEREEGSAMEMRWQSCFRIIRIKLGPAFFSWGARNQRNLQSICCVEHIDLPLVPKVRLLLRAHYVLAQWLGRQSRRRNGHVGRESEENRCRTIYCSWNAAALHTSPVSLRQPLPQIRPLQMVPRYSSLTSTLPLL